MLLPELRQLEMLLPVEDVLAVILRLPARVGVIRGQAMDSSYFYSYIW